MDNSSAFCRICSMFSSCRRADSSCFCWIFICRSLSDASWAACSAERRSSRSRCFSRASSSRSYKRPYPSFRYPSTFFHLLDESTFSFSCCSRSMRSSRWRRFSCSWAILACRSASSARLRSSTAASLACLRSSWRR